LIRHAVTVALARPGVPVVQLAKRVLVLSVLLVGAESLVSGHRVKGLREATAHRAAFDAVAASWTIGSEKTGSCAGPGLRAARAALICVS